MCNTNAHPRPHNHTDTQNNIITNMDTHLHTVAELNQMQGYRFPKQKIEFAALWQYDLDIKKTINFFLLIK